MYCVLPSGGVRVLEVPLYLPVYIASFRLFLESKERSAQGRAINSTVARFSAAHENPKPSFFSFYFFFYKPYTPFSCLHDTHSLLSYRKLSIDSLQNPRTRSIPQLLNHIFLSSLFPLAPVLSTFIHLFTTLFSLFFFRPNSLSHIHWSSRFRFFSCHLTYMFECEVTFLGGGQGWGA